MPKVQLPVGKSMTVPAPQAAFSNSSYQLASSSPVSNEAQISINMTGSMTGRSSARLNTARTNFSMTTLSPHSGAASPAATASPYSGVTSTDMLSQTLPAMQIRRLPADPLLGSQKSISRPTSPLHAGHSPITAAKNGYAHQLVQVQQVAHVQQPPTLPLVEQRSFGTVPHIVQGSSLHVAPASPVHVQPAEVQREHIDVNAEDLKEFENRILSLLEQLALQTESKLREQHEKLREQHEKILQLESSVEQTAQRCQQADLSSAREAAYDEMLGREISKLSFSIEERFVLMSQQIAEEHRQRQTDFDAFENRIGSLEKSDSAALIQQIQHTSGLESKEAQIHQLLNVEMNKMSEVLYREMNKMNITVEARFAQMDKDRPARGRSAEWMDHSTVRELVKKETAELEKQVNKKHHELSTKAGENFDELSVKYETMLNQHSELSERLARADDTMVNKWPLLNERLARAETNYNRGLSGRSDRDLEYLKQVLTEYTQEQLAPIRDQQAQTLEELQGLHTQTLAELQSRQAQSIADWKTLAQEQVKAELLKLDVQFKSLVAAEVRRIGNAELEAETLARTKNVAALHTKVGQELAEVRKTIEMYRGEFGSQPLLGGSLETDVLTPRMEASLDQFVRGLVARDIQRERETRFTQVSELRSAVQQLTERAKHF